MKKKNCNCRLWRDPVEAQRFKDQAIPENFCAFCTSCGKPGHDRQTITSGKGKTLCDSCHSTSRFLEIFWPAVLFGGLALILWILTNSNRPPPF